MDNKINHKKELEELEEEIKEWTIYINHLKKFNIIDERENNLNKILNEIKLKHKIVKNRYSDNQK